MSSFVGLNTALSGLMAQRRAMEVTAQNIANQNTEGYTRQRTDMSSVGGNTVPAIHSTWQGAGGGVTVTGLTRIRDAFLEGRAHVEGGIAAQLEGSDAVLATVEQAFGEPGDQGLQKQMATFWGAFGDVVSTPGELGPRSVLLAQAKGVVDKLHDTDRALTAATRAYSVKVDVLVAEVNATANNVAQLNGAIKQATMAGLPANELLDKRDVLVSKLATMVGATARPIADGVVDVVFGASPPHSLVSGSNAAPVQVTRDGSGAITGLSNASGTGIAFTAGTARGLIDGVRPGGVIDTYRGRLDVLAKQLHDEVNADQTNGYDLISPDAKAGAFFGSSSGGVTAATLTVALTDPRGVAAASIPGPTLDGSNAAKMSKVGDPARAGSPDAAYRSVVANLGVEAQASSRRLDVQANSLALINAAREAQSGVSTDEEMTQLLSYQRAYEAAARVMTTVDSALDTLINRTGLVGR